MGFFAEVAKTKRKKPAISNTLLHQMECKACPLDKTKLKTPKMPVTGNGSKVYMLGEAPGRTEDEEGQQFIGRAGTLLRAYIPKGHSNDLVWDNTIRCRPPDNRTPEPIEIECCRPRHIRDIENIKPKAVFGFGTIPLQWAIGQSGISKWRGRRFPVKIGQHTSWYYAFLHPSYVLRMQNQERDSEYGRVLKADLQRAFDEIETLPEPYVHTSEDAFEGVQVLTKTKEITALLNRISKEWKYAGFDYETTHLRPYSQGARILTVGLSNGKESYSFQYSTALKDSMREFLLSPVVKIVHNLSFEMEWSLFHFGREVLRSSRWEDTLTQAAVLDGRVGDSKPGCLSLEFLGIQYFGINIKKLSNLDRANLISAPVDEVCRYNACDAKYHYWLYAEQYKRLKREGLMHVYEMMLRRVPTLVLTQAVGFPVDIPTVERLSEKYTSEIEKVQHAILADPAVKQAQQLLKKEFNPSSNKHLETLFRDVLKSPLGYKTEDGKEKYSVDEKTLSKIDHSVARLIINNRKLLKKKSTYNEPYKTYMFPDGLLHPSFSHTNVITGRLACSSPNMQNVPKRTEGGKEVRQQFKAREGYSILAFDYGQIEARVIAMASKDPIFVKALHERYDIHAEWARRIALAYPARIGGKENLTNKKVMKELRQDCKTGWTFALVYGATLSTCAYQLQVPEELLKPLYEEFWKMFSATADWQQDQLEFYRKHGYIECLTGRRCYAPLKRNDILNYPIQGTAADLCVDAMDRLSEKEVWDLQPNLQIHDDLTFIMPDSLIPDLMPVIVTEMLRFPTYDFTRVVPVSVEISQGRDWAAMEELAVIESDEWFAGEQHG